MLPQRHLSDIQSLTAALRRQQMLTLAMALAIILLVGLSLGKTQTVVLEPPTRSKTISMTGDRVDGAWLEEMGTWIAHMMLDASPPSIAMQHEQVLRWTHPARYGQLQQDMAVAARRLIDANASTVFWLQQVAPDPDRQRVAMLGLLETYVNGVRVTGSTKTVSYVADFESKGGRVLLRDWKETPTDDIWLARMLENLAREQATSLKRNNANKH
ncbi:MAG: TraE/TraK family type IV conjugative transfer system protein [Rubrivivax sp.]